MNASRPRAPLIQSPDGRAAAGRRSDLVWFLTRGPCRVFPIWGGGFTYMVIDQESDARSAADAGRLTPIRFTLFYLLDASMQQSTLDYRACASSDSAPHKPLHPSPPEALDESQTRGNQSLVHSMTPSAKSKAKATRWPTP